MNIIRRKDLDGDQQVYYCSSDYSFKHNWVQWDHKDCERYRDVMDFDIIFGVIRDGLFYYVEE